MVLISQQVIEDAIDCSILNKLSFWDSLIVSAAEYSKCDTLWTEDLSHGQIIRGVKVLNPMLEN